MTMAKHIFIKELRSDKLYWGLYIALVWAVMLSIRIIDNNLNSPEAGPTGYWLLLSSLGIVLIMAVFFVFRSPMGWCLVTAVHLIQVGDSIIGVFSVLGDAKLDGEHIIGMARNGVGTALGIIIVVYLFQSYNRELFSMLPANAKGKKPDSKI